MKILIGYDGSSCSEAALDDLKLAGLPEDTEAIVLSIAEVWLPPPPKGESLSDYAAALQAHQQPFKAYQTSAKAITEVETLAKHAEDRLRRMFPTWKITSNADYGSPAWEILTKAYELKSDLIVVGSHGRSAVARLFLGSISQKVLTEAPCSVRIARGKIEIDPIPSRIIIGYDGSPGAEAAVEAVAARCWREQSEVKLVIASDPVTPSAIGRFIPPVADWVEDANADEHERLENLAQSSITRLSKSGLTATLLIKAGNPKQILIEEAEHWHANSIFLGANAHGSRLGRFLLGSTAAAIAERAKCSVEVVRKAV